MALLRTAAKMAVAQAEVEPRRRVRTSRLAAPQPRSPGNGASVNSATIERPRPRRTMSGVGSFSSMSRSLVTGGRSRSRSRSGEQRLCAKWSRDLAARRPLTHGLRAGPIGGPSPPGRRTSYPFADQRKRTSAREHARGWPCHSPTRYIHCSCGRSTLRVGSTQG